MNGWTRFAALSAPRRSLLLRAFVQVLRARAGLLLLPFPQAIRSAPVSPRRDAAACDPHEAAWAVSAVARRIPGTRCLASSIALHRMLRDAGIDSELRFGVAKTEDGSIQAHAWVFADGHPLESPHHLEPYAELGTCN